MDTFNLEQNINKLTEAIQDLSDQIQKLKSSEESEKMEEHKSKGTLLEFNLVTGGVIIGKLVWVGSQSFGIETTQREFILYKHAISFIQERKEQ